MPAISAALAVPLPFRKPDRPHRRPASAIADHEAPLIRRAQAGNSDAVGELYSRYEDRVRRFLASRLRGRDADVDDLVAETFLAAVQRIGAFELDRPGEFGNWLIGIARNLHLRWLQRVANREAALDDHVAERAHAEACRLSRSRWTAWSSPTRSPG